jgi:hypothetical protein
MQNQQVINQLELNAAAPAPKSAQAASVQNYDPKTVNIEWIFTKLMQQSMDKTQVTMQQVLALQQIEDNMNMDLIDFLNKLKQLQQLMNGGNDGWTPPAGDSDAQKMTDLYNHYETVLTGQDPKNPQFGPDWMHQFQADYQDLFVTQHTITVPTNDDLTPGSNGTVTFKGTWIDLYIDVNKQLNPKFSSSGDSITQQISNINADFAKFTDKPPSGDNFLDYLQGYTSDVNGENCLAYTLARAYMYQHSDPSNKGNYSDAIGDAVSSISAKSSLLSGLNNTNSTELNMNAQMLQQYDQMGQSGIKQSTDFISQVLAAVNNSK